MTKVRSEYEIGLKDDTSRTLARMTGGVEKFSKAIAGLGAIGGAGALVAVTANIRSAVNLADDLGKAAQKTGVTVEALSALNYAAKLSDVSTEGLVGGIQKLAKTMAEAAKGAVAQRTAFEATNIAFQNTDGTLRSTTDVFSDLAKFFATLPDGATKTALAMQFFGKTGAELIPLLNGNADGFKAVTEEAKQFGVVISKELAQQSENLNDNFTRLGEATSALGISLASDVVPGLANLTTEFVKNYREADGLLRVFTSLGTTLSSLGRGSDQEKLGDLLNEEVALEQKIRDLQKAFDEGDAGKLVFIGRMKLLKDELASVRAQAEGLRAVMQPDQFGGAPAPQGQEGPPISDAQRRANEARVRAALDSAAAESAAAKQRQTEQDRLLEAQETYLAKQRESLALEGQTTEEAKVLADIKFGALSKFSAATQREALENAKQLDMLRDEVEIQKSINEQVDARSELEAKATKALADKRQAVIDSLLTPLEEYTARVQELVDLQLSPDQLSRGITLARVELTDAQNKAAGLKDTVRELGVTFSSSFAEAITGGEKLLDVIGSLGRDLAAILLNKAITVPLANLLGGSEGSPGLLEKGASGFGQWIGSLFGNANGGLYKIAGGSSEHPVMLSGKAGEVVAVGRGMTDGNSGGAMAITVHNYGPSQDVSARSDGRSVDVFIGASLAKSVASGRTMNLGLAPALATR